MDGWVTEVAERPTETFIFTRPSPSAPVYDPLQFLFARLLIFIKTVVGRWLGQRGASKAE